MTLLRLSVHALATLFALVAAAAIAARVALNAIHKPVYLRPTLKEYRADLAIFFAAACVAFATEAV